MTNKLARLGVLSSPRYRTYWIGHFVSQTGTAMQIVAEGWLVTRLTGSVAALGLVHFAFSLPILVFSLLGGVVADRRDRRAVAMTAQVGPLLIALGMAWLVATDRLQMWHVLLAAFLAGLASAYDLPARQALVPSLVEPSQIGQAIAMSTVAYNASRLIGPAIAAVAIARLGPSSAYVSNALSFGVAILCLSMLDVPARTTAVARPRSSLSALREGLAHVARSRGLSGAIGLGAVTALLVFPVFAVLSPAYVRDVLHAGPGSLGAMISVGGGTSLIGAFVMMAIRRAWRRPAMIVCVGLITAALPLLVLARGAAVLAYPAFGALSVGFTMLYGFTVVAVQEMAPDDLRGRIMSIGGLSFSASVNLGVVGVSFGVDRVGFDRAYVVIAVVFAAIALVLLRRSRLFADDATMATADRTAPEKETTDALRRERGAPPSPPVSADDEPGSASRDRPDGPAAAGSSPGEPSG